MLRPAHLLPPKRLSTPHPARHHSITNRGLLPGAPVPTKTGPTPANSIQLPGHDIGGFLDRIMNRILSRPGDSRRGQL
jgi:hypothetical protein